MDDQQNEPNVLIAWILGIAVTLAIVVSLVVGIVAGTGAGKSEPAKAAAPAAAAPAAVQDEVETAPPAATGEGIPQVVKLYFDSGKAELPADAAAQLQAIVAFANATPAANFAISGFHDKTGDAAQNAELAKARAKASREVLVAAGIAAQRVVLVKPRETEGGADDREARRVEIYPVQ